MKPTIIGGGDVPKPTVIHATQMPAHVEHSPTPAQHPPTVINTGTKSEDIQLPLISPVVKPSIMPGTTRKRIDIQKADLRKKVNSSDSTLDCAIRIIESTNQDDVTTNTAVLWGQQAQEKHNSLIETSLKLAQSEVVLSTTTNLNRAIQILTKIELETIFSKPANFVVGMLRKRNDKIDSEEELDEALRELSQLTGLMKERITELLQLRTSLEINSKEIAEAGNEIESFMIAALALADYFSTKESRLDISTCFQTRAESLTVTLGLIRSSGSMRTLHIEQPMRLTTLIQETVFNTLPSWMTSVTALRSTLHSKQPNPTEVSEISRILKTIIQKLS